MKTANGFLIFLVMLVLVVIFLFSYQEKYSPYRGTDTCHYLNIYDTQDYYKNHPYVYPTPNSYTLSWYHNRRKLNEQTQEFRDLYFLI